MWRQHFIQTVSSLAICNDGEIVIVPSVIRLLVVVFGAQTFKITQTLRGVCVCVFLC